MKYRVLLVLLLLPGWLMSQRFVYDVDFVTDFDNREYQTPYNPSQTIFGLRLTPLVGVELSDSLGGTHRLMGGVTYVQPFGAAMQQGKLWPTIYYKYQQSGFQVNMGAIPYTGLAVNLPTFLRSDSLSFAYPNIQGALLGYESDKGYVQFFCDWRGLQSKTTREAFRLVLLGQYQYKWFYTGGFAAMNHLANKAKSEPHLGVCDDITINPYIGADFSKMTGLDTLSIRIGYLGGYYTDRKAGEQQLASGFLCDMSVQWRFLALDNSLYVGQAQMPYFNRYGSVLYQGSPFYQSRFYNRTDLMVYLIRRPFVNCFFSWNLHWVDGFGVNNQQRMVLRFNLNGFKKKHQLRNI